MGHLSALLFLVFFSVQVTSKCPNGWMPYDLSCYRLFEDNVNWAHAQFQCETHNGYLAVTDHTQEISNVHQLMKDLRIGSDTRIWIGLADMRIEGVFVWENTKRNATVFDWAANEPNGHDGHNEDCIMLFGQQGFKWADVDCQRQYSYLCERHRDTPID